MAIDLKNLIDQVLGMARESLDLRKRNAEASWYGGNKDEEEYWKEMRRRNTELELRGAEGKNRLAEREMINSGDLEKQRVADAGALARQGLANEATRYTADQNLQAHQYTADTNYAMKRDELNKGYDPELIKAHAAVIANVNSSPEAVASSQAAIDWYTKNTMNKQAQARQGLVAEQPAPAAATPSASSDVIEKPAALKVAESFTGANKPPDYRDSGFYKPGPAVSGSSNPSQNYQETAQKYLGALSDPVGSLLAEIVAKRLTSPTPATETPATPATGLGGSIGRGIYGITHPSPLEEPARSPRVESPARKAMDKFVFDTAPTAIANTARSAATGAYEFGQNIPRGYDERKEEEARKKRKALGNY